jgi:hypothetical protein
MDCSMKVKTPIHKRNNISYSRTPQQIWKAWSLSTDEITAETILPIRM